MTNDTPLEEAGDYAGFFIRDSDPVTKTETNSDLLFERGDKELARGSGIAFDSSWFPVFNFKGQGNRASDDFFYEPYAAAMTHPGSGYEQPGLLVCALYPGRSCAG